MTTTTPAITQPLATSPDKCPEILTYEQLRQSNLKEIETYFNNLYTEYNKFKPAVEKDAAGLNKYEEQLDLLSEEMVNKLQDNLTATIEQHNIYIAKQKEVDENRAQLRLLKQSVKDETITRDARNASFNETQTYRETKTSWHYSYMAINIIILLINLVMLAKLF